MKIHPIISNFLLVVHCFLFFLFHGRANKCATSPRSVVIIQRAKLGDMIASTPIFRAIKKVYPECKITVVGNAVNEKIIDGNPDVDTYIIWEDDVSKMVGVLKEGAYDFGCTTSPNLASVAALYLAGIKCVAAPFITCGWSPYETKSYTLVRSYVIKKEHRMRHYVPKEYLRLLEPIGIITDDTSKHIFWSEQADGSINEFISGIEKEYLFLVGIIPGAGNKIKQWPARRFAEVADHLIEKYRAVILVIGNESNRTEIDEMLSCVKSKEWVLDCSWTSVDELKALVSKLDMSVSVDTGPIFIAEASKVPTIDIGGALEPNEMAPNDGKFHLLIKASGEPQIWTMNARVINREEARRQVESITVSEVIEKVDELLHRIQQTNN